RLVRRVLSSLPSRSQDRGRLDFAIDRLCRGFATLAHRATAPPHAPGPTTMSIDATDASRAKSLSGEQHPGHGQEWKMSPQTHVCGPPPPPHPQCTSHALPPPSLCLLAHSSSLRGTAPRRSSRGRWPSLVAAILALGGRSLSSLRVREL